MWRMSPIAPLSTTRLSSRIEAKQRLLLPLPSTMPASRQAATARAASFRVSASGFSHQTGFPARRDRLDLRHVERMRRRQEHGLHGRVGDGVGEVGGEPKAVLAGKAAHVVRLLADAVNEAQPLALALHGGHQRLAPAPKPNNGSIDHIANVQQSR